MKKIGIDARELKKITGISRILTYLLQYEKLYSEFKIFLFGNQYTNFNNINEKIVYVTINEKITLLWDQILLNNAIKKYEIDLFFSPYYKFPLLTDIPSIISIHDITYLLIEPYRNQIKNKFFIKNFIKIAAKKVKKIITCSNSTKKDLCKILNIEEDKIEIIYDAVSNEFSPKDKQDVLKVKNKYNINKKYILYVGNSKPHKNLNRLIQAYELLPKEIKEEYMLILIGVESSSLIKYQVENVKLIKTVNNEELISFYSGADLFVFPSLYEGFGLPPLEAMACGCPVVVSNISSISEILEDAAVYFNPYSIDEISKTIAKVLLDEDLKKRLRDKGFLQKAKFSIEKMCSKYLQIFKSVIG